MASAIPPPHVPFAPGSSSLLDVPRLGALVPFPHSRLLHPGFLFWCFAILFFCLFLCFLSFFAVFVDLLRASFVAPRPLLSFFRTPTATSFHRALLCTGLTYTRSFFFLYFFLLVFSYVAFLFPVFHLLFACNNALASMIRLDPL
jgi:hypothetical protein